MRRLKYLSFYHTNLKAASPVIKQSVVVIWYPAEVDGVGRGAVPPPVGVGPREVVGGTDPATVVGEGVSTTAILDGAALTVMFMPPPPPPGPPPWPPPAPLPPPAPPPPPAMTEGALEGSAPPPPAIEDGATEGFPGACAPLPETPIHKEKCEGLIRVYLAQFTQYLRQNLTARQDKDKY